MERWYTVFTKPRAERQVARRLAGRGIEAYVPLLEVGGRKGKARDIPFFPRYMFARFDWEKEGAAPVRWTPGLTSIVTFDDRPAWVSDEWVAALRTGLDALDGDAFLSLKPGERVRVREGPFRDVEAIFERRMNGEARVAILLEIVGRQTRVIVDEGTVERIA